MSINMWSRGILHKLTSPFPYICLITLCPYLNTQNSLNTQNILCECYFYSLFWPMLSVCHGEWMLLLFFILVNVKWVPCHHDMAQPLVVDGRESPQAWGKAAYILNKQLCMADKGWSSNLGVGWGLTTPTIIN